MSILLSAQLHPDAVSLTAVDQLVEGRWTEMIHDEWIRNLAASAPAIPVERLQNTRRLMNTALPMAMVNRYEEQIPIVHLPDPNGFVATFPDRFCP